MTELHQALGARVATWRETGYASDRFPAIVEILGYAFEDDGRRHSRFLRAAQFRALETYWYLRLVEGTPRVATLYERSFDRVADRLTALGLASAELRDLALEGYDTLIERIRSDDDLARRHRLDALRETLALEYPSWILALAMGAGKTVLIGAIVATEFAMALEYPEAETEGTPFIENALVFAPGTTILQSLRELSNIPFELILPPRLFERFAPSLKITYTRDGERDIPITRGSRFNLVVTNTEKIRIQARPSRKTRTGAPLRALFDRSEEEAREVANLRLQAIASLPHLGIFSDEAHHTYGRALGSDLKRVRQTVDYLAAETNVIAVVNTTGTPYFERQPLRDVVVWYGLRQGIQDGILKEVAGNIRSYAFQPGQADEMVADVVRDFLTEYGDHSIADGSPAKLAIYVPTVDDLRELRPHVELAVANARYHPSIVTECTNASSPDERDAFNRFRYPDSPHRIVLLVNMGTEGWDCPSLFATALARRLRTSNNFVLQAASRCLRQVPGNDRPARIYLSDTNLTALDTQLKETYGETLADVGGQRRQSKRRLIRVRKTDLPVMRVRMPERKLTRDNPPDVPLALEAPPHVEDAGLSMTFLEVGLGAASRRMLRQVGDSVAVETSVDTLDPYAAAVQLGANYRLDAWTLLDGVRSAYPEGQVPVAHLAALGAQIETWLGEWREGEEIVARDLRILKPEGFTIASIDGDDVPQLEISYPVDHEGLVWDLDRISENLGDYGFHYVPYNFDSTPEADFYEKVLRELNLTRDDVQDVYYTGAITDPRKTDLSFAYPKGHGSEGRYTPDFVILATGDRWMLVEVKMTGRRNDPIEGEGGVKARAIEQLAELDPERIVYRMVFADQVVPATDVAAVRDFLAAGDVSYSA